MDADLSPSGLSVFLFGSRKTLPLMSSRSICSTLLCVLAIWSQVAAVDLRAELPRANPLVGELQNTPRLRRPVSIARIGERIVIANRIGSISIVDARRLQVLNEVAVAERLDDLVAIPETNRLLAVDSTAHELICLAVDGDRVSIDHRIRVPAYPVSIATNPQGTRAIVASLWSRRLSVVDLTPSEPRVLATCDVPFAPRMLCLLDERHCLVGDSFGGGLAVFDIESGRLRSHQQINGHNIRGMTLTSDRKSIVLTHQILHGISSTTRSIISWGGVISNTLHTIPVERLLMVENGDSARPQPIHGGLYPLGEERNAAGDPGDIVSDSQGRFFIALAGVSQIARKEPLNFKLARTSVGRHPTRLLLEEPKSRLFSIDTFDDALSVLDSETLQVTKTVSLGRVATRSLAEQGEEHFFDARLSLDGWYSCHSCHTDGHTTNLLNDNFGDSTFNTPKRILSLLGTGATEPWAWDASQSDLRNQIRSSISNTMNGPEADTPRPSFRLVESLNSYVSQLGPAPGILTARGEADRPSVKRGGEVFKSHGCDKCHQPPSYTSPLAFDVGLHDEAGKKYFNPPSLLGVSQRSPYFHDNRAKLLRDVFENFDHDRSSTLGNEQKVDLIDFLNSL